MVIYTIVNVSVFGICLAAMLKKNTDEAMSINNTNGMRGFFIMLMMVPSHIAAYSAPKRVDFGIQLGWSAAYKCFLFPFRIW